jgi:hypothetical protein
MADENLRIPKNRTELSGPMWFIGDCVTALPAKATFYAPILTEEDSKRLEQTIRNPPKPDAGFVERAVAEIPSLCTFLEKRLNRRNDWSN